LKEKKEERRGEKKEKGGKGKRKGERWERIGERGREWEKRERSEKRPRKKVKADDLDMYLKKFKDPYAKRRIALVLKRAAVFSTLCSPGPRERAKGNPPPPLSPLVYGLISL
jgi:hypothetical protein